MTPNYPKKNILSYLLPFFLIVVLLGSGWIIVNYKVNLEDVRKVLQAPKVPKDQKVKIAYQEGDNQIKPWSEEVWKPLQQDATLQVGDTLKTGTGGVLVLRFFEESEVRVSEKSEMKVIRIDKNESSGDHIAVELISGKLWRRGKKANTPDADFIVNTNQLAVLMNDAAVMDTSGSPEALRVIGGKVICNVAEMSGGVRKPIARVEVEGGQQLLLDNLVMDQLKSGEKNVVTNLDDAYLKSDWYVWNIEKEEKLGFVVEPKTRIVKTQPELETLGEDLVTIASPKSGESVGSKILVSGSYDQEKISKIFVNGQEATLGLTDQWEIGLELSEQQNIITVTALEKDSTVQKQLKPMSVKVDATGPLLGKITKPEIDDNGNGIIVGDKIEIGGEVATDAKKICVTFNDKDPYCLKQFKPGDKVYKYLGGVGYGNLATGQNKYTIYAYDLFDNSNQKTIYIFKDVPKPSTKILESVETQDLASLQGRDAINGVSTELPKPTITRPDPSIVLNTSDTSVTITGTVDGRTQSILVNGKKADYKSGSTDFSLTLDLTMGENNIKIQAVDSLGNKSKTTLLTVLRLEKDAVIKP